MIIETTILETVNSPADLKKLSVRQLKLLAQEIRQLILNTVSKTGGHLASSLGTVELTLALHKVFNSPHDKIVWDVGHQSYAHKIITGRRKVFETLRTFGGISGFPNIFESPHDAFGTGHSSTSISAALGLAIARDKKGEKNSIIAIIGDGALTGGLAFEALNHAGHLNKDFTVIVNDNEMSIAKNVGAISAYLSQIRLAPSYRGAKKDLKTFIKQIPHIGEQVFKTAKTIEEHLTYLVVPGVFFESLGYTYLGPFDGHDIGLLIDIFQKIKHLRLPKVIHIITKKGRGYLHAENNAERFHGAVPFEIETGKSISVNINPSYTDIFGKTIAELGKINEKILVITAAMSTGTGTELFREKFPDRFFDVGIAEPHAVVLAASLAREGFIPVVAIYSTFLQRAYDHIIHDVCIQKLPVVFMLDRAGIVGEDGATHQGIFDLSYLGSMPNMCIMAPKDEDEFKNMIYTAINLGKPAAVRYPRGCGPGVKPTNNFELIPEGKSEIIKEGKDVVLWAIGNMVYPSVEAAGLLSKSGINATVVNARFRKPIDDEMLYGTAEKAKMLVTVEENVITGGFGSSVNQLLSVKGYEKLKIFNMGINDKFVEHGAPDLIREKYGLTKQGITDFILKNYNFGK